MNSMTSAAVTLSARFATADFPWSKFRRVRHGGCRCTCGKARPRRGSQLAKQVGEHLGRDAMCSCELVHLLAAILIRGTKGAYA